MSSKMCENRSLHAQRCSSHTDIFLGVHSWGLKNHKESYENDKFISMPCVVYTLHLMWVAVGRQSTIFGSAGHPWALISGLWYCQLWVLFTCRKGKAPKLSVTYTDLGGEPCPGSISRSKILTVPLDSAKTAIGYGSLWSLQGSPSENNAFITVGISRVHFVWITPSLHPEIRSKTDLL